MMSEFGIVLFILFYGGLAALCFTAALKRVRIYSARKRKPKLTLIQGGKKEIYTQRNNLL